MHRTITKLTTLVGMIAGGGVGWIVMVLLNGRPFQFDIATITIGTHALIVMLALVARHERQHGGSDRTMWLVGLICGYVAGAGSLGLDSNSLSHSEHHPFRFLRYSS